MDPQDILTLAQHGDPKIIEALINHTTQPRGITARVRRRDACLHVLLESPKALNQQASVAFIRKRLESLNVEPIATVKVYGRQVGNKEFVWNQEIPLMIQSDLLDPLEYVPEDHPPASDPDDQENVLLPVFSQEIEPALEAEEMTLSNGERAYTSSGLEGTTVSVQPLEDQNDLAIDNPIPLEGVDSNSMNANSLGDPEADSGILLSTAGVGEQNSGLPLEGADGLEDLAPEADLVPVATLQESISALQGNPLVGLAASPEEDAVLVEAVLVEEDLDWDSDDEMVLYGGDRLSQSISEILQRPEALIFLVFVAFVMVWDLYLDLMTEASENGISGRELARRLGVNHSTISRRKERDDFSLWSQTLDPDGVAWVYENGGFMPKFETSH